MWFGVSAKFSFDEFELLFLLAKHFKVRADGPEWRPCGSDLFRDVAHLNETRCGRRTAPQGPANPARPDYFQRLRNFDR